MSSIAENLERVREQIASAAANSGRSADDVELVAITKTHPAEKVREAVEAGQTLFGESRVQEARAKIPELSSNLALAFCRTSPEKQNAACPATIRNDSQRRFARSGARH